MEKLPGYWATVIVLALLNVFVGTLVGVTKHFIDQEKSNYITKAPFCVDCSDVLGHPDDGLPRGVTAYESKCCADNDAHLVDLVKAVTNIWQDKKLKEVSSVYVINNKGENPQLAACRTNTTYNKPVLKLHLSDVQTMSNQMEVEWEKVIDYSTDGYLEYAGGYVTIRHTALYHIYSMVSFRFQENTTTHPDLPKQHIIGYQHVGSSPSDYKYIAKGSNTQCKFPRYNGGNTHNSTSFIGTVYKLHNGDKVSVRVHDRSQLLHNKHMNFFGIHMV